MQLSYYCLCHFCTFYFFTFSILHYISMIVLWLPYHCFCHFCTYYFFHLFNTLLYLYYHFNLSFDISFISLSFISLIFSFISISWSHFILIYIIYNIYVIYNIYQIYHLRYRWYTKITVYIYACILHHVFTFNLKYFHHYHFPVNSMFIVIVLLLLLQEVWSILVNLCKCQFNETLYYRQFYSD